MRLSVLLASSLVSGALLAGCAPAADPEPTLPGPPVVTPSETPSPSPVDEAIPPADELGVDRSTLARWGKEWKNIDKTLAKQVDPKVPSNNLCIALPGLDRAWFGVQEVSGDAKTGVATFGFLFGPGQPYTCDASTAVVVVDLATREAVRGEALFQQIEEAAAAQ